MQKTIYIRDEDIPLFERAQEITKESLSWVLSEALRDYVRKIETEQQGFTTITIKIGKDLTPSGSGTYRKIRFIGRLVAERKTTLQDRIRYVGGDDWELYRTLKGGWVVIRERWESDYEQTMFYTTREYWTAKTEEELRLLNDENGEPLVPSDLIEIGLQNTGYDLIEELDI